MSAELFIANNLRIAAEDLAGAKTLASTNNRNAVYLCEQAAEKIIRAVLTSEGKQAGIGHQLDAMVDLVPDENPMKQLLRNVESLAAFATTFRYPTPSRIKPAPSATDLAKYLADVDQLLAEVVKHFGVDLTKANAPAHSSRPVR